MTPPEIHSEVVKICTLSQITLSEYNLGGVPGEQRVQDVRAAQEELLRALRVRHPHRLRPQALAPRGQPLSLAQLRGSDRSQDQERHAGGPPEPGARFNTVLKSISKSITKNVSKSVMKVL